MSRIRSVILLIFIPLFTLFCSCLAVFVYAPFLSKKQCDALIKFWSNALLVLSGIKCHVSGLENLESLKSAILISNHFSFFDIPVLYANLPLSFRMAAKAELFRVPIFGMGLKAFGFFPIERRNPENAAQAFKAMEKRFQQGGSIWMAPEGTRQEKPEIGPFKMGAFVLSLRAGQALVPIVISGTEQVLKKNSWLVNWRSWNQDVYVDVGKAISPSDWSLESRHEFRDHVHEAMRLSLGRISNKLDKSTVL
jgi:1-acyl-sn-glycerol-3-phosphate acyltransferase